jgi:hypothetical protein
MKKYFAILVILGGILFPLPRAYEAYIRGDNDEPDWMTIARAELGTKESPVYNGCVPLLAKQ